MWVLAVLLIGSILLLNTLVAVMLDQFEISRHERSVAAMEAAAAAEGREH